MDRGISIHHLYSKSVQNANLAPTTQNNRETEVGEDMQGRGTHGVALDSRSLVRSEGG